MRYFKILLILLLLLFVALAAAQDAETIVIRGFGNISTFNPAHEQRWRFVPGLQRALAQALRD